MKIKKYEESENFFNEPWMRNINNKLLRRYWSRKKGAMPLATEHYGMIIVSYKSPFGILDEIKEHPNFREKFTKDDDQKLF